MAKETVLLVVAFAAAAAFLCSCPAIVSARKVGGTCALSRNCDAGLHCETCVVDGNVRPRCTRVTPVDPQSKDRGLPFNRYAWLTTHNSFARLGTQSQTGTAIVTAFNQQDTIAEQLNVSPP
uniref:PI-PLC X domain-containing protein n=1 Tax=Aegilops tauschii subsp. strangulata TaxID=200361 RepID=A0A453BZI9_AEGTS